jgi:autoinducer 2-degrading protein
MITRIVKMSFVPEKINNFLQIYFDAKPFIEMMPGCKKVSLHQEVQEANKLYTISIWDSEDDLNYYRNSELFEKTWAKTKILFNDKPMAWSLNPINDITANNL